MLQNTLHGSSDISLRGQENNRRIQPLHDFSRISFYIHTNELLLGPNIKLRNKHINNKNKKEIEIERDRQRGNVQDYAYILSENLTYIAHRLGMSML